MNCPKCNSPVLPNARFCGTCGQPIAAAPAPEPALSAVSPTGGAAAATAAWSVPPTASAVPGLVQRIKSILLTPRTEWPVIAPEPTTASQLFMGYVAPLAVMSALLAFIHLSVIGVNVPFAGTIRTPFINGLFSAALTVVFGFIGVFLVGLIINGLAPTFGGTRDQRQALKCAAYSLTPAYAGALLALSPLLPTLLQLLAGCYGIYVLALGLPVMMRSPKDRAVGYTATVVVCCFLLGIVLAMASASLGIVGRTGGLLGSRETSDAQTSAEVGNAIGNVLGTDAKGKEGITSALNNLVKAGEQSEAASRAAAAPTAAPATAANSTGASATGAGADTAQNPAAAVGGLVTALGGALGGEHPVAVVDFHALTPLLPASVPGMKRTDARGESQGAMGVKTASATGIYQGDNGAHLQVEITDMTAVSGLMGLAAMAPTETSESTSGFERDQTVGGRTVHEKYDNAGKHGVLTAMIAKRFQVELTGDGVEMGMLEQTLNGIDLAHLEAMKNQAGPAN